MLWVRFDGQLEDAKMEEKMQGMDVASFTLM